MKESIKSEDTEFENRWCKKCFSKTQQELLNSDLQMTGKKNKISLQVYSLWDDYSHAKIPWNG